jgi:hypothetical protein
MRVYACRIGARQTSVCNRHVDMLIALDLLSISLSEPHRTCCVNFFILSPHYLFNSLASYALRRIEAKPVVINGEVLCLKLLLYHLPTHLD